MLKHRVFHVAGHRLIMPSRLKWCKRWSHGAYERSILEGNDYFTDVAKGNVAYCCMEYRTFDGFVFPMRHRNRRSVAHADRHRVKRGRAWPNCRRPNPAWAQGASSKRVNVKGGLSATQRTTCSRKVNTTLTGLDKVSAAIQAALMNTLGVPAEDFYQLVFEFPRARFRHTPSFVGMLQDSKCR